MGKMMLGEQYSSAENLEWDMQHDVFIPNPLTGDDLLMHQVVYHFKHNNEEAYQQARKALEANGWTLRCFPRGWTATRA